MRTIPTVSCVEKNVVCSCHHATPPLRNGGRLVYDYHNQNNIPKISRTQNQNSQYITNRSAITTTGGYLGKTPYVTAYVFRAQVCRC